MSGTKSSSSNKMKQKSNSGKRLQDLLSRVDILVKKSGNLSMVIVVAIGVIGIVVAITSYERIPTFVASPVITKLDSPVIDAGTLFCKDGRCPLLPDESEDVRYNRVHEVVSLPFDNSTVAGRYVSNVIHSGRSTEWTTITAIISTPECVIESDASDLCRYIDTPQPREDIPAARLYTRTCGVSGCSDVDWEECELFNSCPIISGEDNNSFQYKVEFISPDPNNSLLLHEVQVDFEDVEADRCPKCLGRVATRQIGEDDFILECEGKPYRPVGDFLTSGGIPKNPTHCLFSPEKDMETKVGYIIDSVLDGYNVLNVITVMEDDYDGACHISPFVQTDDPGWEYSGQFDNDTLAEWRRWARIARNRDLRLVVWLFTDDMDHFTIDTHIDDQKKFITKMVKTFDEFNPMYILGLEADEYWGAWNNQEWRVEELGNHLKHVTENVTGYDNPVGIHQVVGKTHLMTQDWVDFGAFQYGNDAWTPEQIQDLTIENNNIGRPFIASEYQYQTVNNSRGDFAVRGGAEGALNGANCIAE